MWGGWGAEKKKHSHQARENMLLGTLKHEMLALRAHLSAMRKRAQAILVERGMAYMVRQVVSCGGTER